jgi:hypothetical protein
MALDFPANPAVNDKYSGYIFMGVAWDVEPDAVVTTDYVLKTGDTMTGPLLVPLQVKQGVTTPGAQAVADQEATSYKFVDDNFTEEAPLTGGPFARQAGAWIVASGLPAIGDLKYALTTADHGGWIRLDGKAITLLTATQQAEAIKFGWTTNVPDAINSVLMQRTGALGLSSGTWSLTQANLPNITLTATQATATPGKSGKAGNHYHPMRACTNDNGTVGLSELLSTYGASGSTNDGKKIWRRSSTIANGNNGNAYMIGQGHDTAGEHDHDITVPAHGHPVPLGGTGAALTPKAITANLFVYLGP